MLVLTINMYTVSKQQSKKKSQSKRGVSKLPNNNIIPCCSLTHQPADSIVLSVMLLLGSPRLLRLSCDRCHKRKQRCTRASAEENSCRRCKEAGEKCVFSPPLRLGRPSKRKKQESKQEEINYNAPDNNFLAISNQDVTRTIAAIAASRTTTQDESSSPLESSPAFSMSGLREMTKSPPAEQNDLTCTAAAINHNVVAAAAFKVWPLSLDQYNDPAMSITTPGLFCGSSLNYNNETWSDLLDDKAHSEPSSSSHIDSLDSSLIAIPGASTSDSILGSIDHEPAIIDPVSLLSQIQLRLHGIQMRRPPQAAELQVIMNQTVQIAQEFIEVLNQILSPCTVNSSPASIQQRQHTPPATSPASNASISSNEETTFHIEWTSKQPMHQQQCAPGTIDTIEVRLALICYIQILRSYKNLVHMLVNSAIMTEAQQGNSPDFVPVQIGTLHTVVSPRLQVALLVQLISQHTDDIRYKTRQLAKIHDDQPHMDSSHSGVFISNIISKDIYDEEEDLRDGLDMISERLKIPSQFRDL